jgi:O-methyltransferase
MNRIASLFCRLNTVAGFLFGPEGSQYGVGFFDKAKLLRRIQKNVRVPGAATCGTEHLELTRAILRTPRDVVGDVAEFGCYKGISTATLSVICHMIGRKLRVFDSFRGLPAPEKPAFERSGGGTMSWQQAEYCGTLEEVRANVAKYGELSCCEFIEGFFNETLPKRPPEEQYVLVFEDADLPASVKEVLQHVWPRLHNDCALYSHEATIVEVVELFFDREWWKAKFNEPPPGFVGSGCGCVVGSHELGYTRKRLHNRASSP